MLTQSQRDRIYETIPTILAGETVTKIHGDDIVAEPGLPRMVVSVITEGVRVHYSRDRIRYRKTTTDGDISTDYWYGQVDRASFSIVLEAYDKDDLGNMGRDLYLYLWESELGLSWDVDRMRLSRIFEPTYLPQIYDNRRGKSIYRLVVDFWVEYEFSWMEKAPLIRKFNYLIQKDETAEIRFSQGDEINSYGMDVIIVKGD